MSRPKTLLSWSSGKDCAYALAALRQDDLFDVIGLVSTVNVAARRVAMHAVRESLLKVQAEAVGLPIWHVDLPTPCSNEEYEAAMGRLIADAVREGVSHMAYGDLFLSDVRAYREVHLAGTGITPVFPLWGFDTHRLAREMIFSGVRAITTCVDPRQIQPTFIGRQFDGELLADLPPTCDPCGENGEFHTFAWDGPAFRRPVPVSVGEIVERDGFVFVDVTANGDGD